MADPNAPPGRRKGARALTEQALEAEQLGEDQRAQELVAAAEKVDPEETIEVLQEQAASSVSMEPEWELPPQGATSFALVLTVNGQRHELMVDARTTLLDALRDRLHLTGTKRGCDLGQCGACTVLVDGRRMNACMMFAAQAENHEVETIEGLTADGEMHKLQKAFIDCDAFQCGYCTPGQIMSALGLIREGKANTDDEIREGMSGNLCRCGAYTNIVDAIRTAAQKMAEETI